MRFSISEESEKQLSYYKEDNNPLSDFIKDMCSVNEYEEINQKDLLQLYETYLDGKPNKFGRNIFYELIVNSSDIITRNRDKRMFYGIGDKETSNYVQDDE